MWDVDPDQLTLYPQLYHHLLQLPGLFVTFYVCVCGICMYMGFPGLASKESTYNAGDPGSIPWSGSSPGEGIGNPLQSSRASLVAQLVKNLPAMQENPD